MRSLSLHLGLEVAVVGLAIAASALGTLGFRGVFDGWTFLWPIGWAALGCLVVGLVARSRDLLLGESILVSILAFVIMGVPATQGGFDLVALQQFTEALLSGWTDLVSLAPPIDMRPEVAVVPYATMWLGAFVATELARQIELPGLPVVAGLTTMAVSILLSVENRSIATIQAVGLLLVLLLLAQLQQRIAEDAKIVDSALTSGGKPLRVRAFVLSALGVVVAGLLATIVGPQLPLAKANERFDLREKLENPFDPLDGPSPLVTLKASLKGDVAKRVDFVVHGDVPTTRWTIAVLDTYGGVVWEVADAAPNFPAKFVPVGRVLPAVQFPPTGGRVTAHRVEIGELAGPWVPHAGTPMSLEFASGEEDVRMSIATGTLGLVRELRPTDDFRVESTPSVDLSDEALANLTFPQYAPGTRLDLAQPAVKERAQQMIEGSPAGGQRVVAIRDALRDGFYDVSPSIQPGHSWARLVDFLADHDRMTGYEEQYAAAAAVLARSANIPSRVVVGYLFEPERWVDGSATVRSGDRSAWIEVLTNEHGWVPIHVTPNEDRRPSDQDPGSEARNVAIPNDPPPPPLPPDDELVEPDDEPEQEEPPEEPPEEPDPPEPGDDERQSVWAWFATPLGLAVLSASSITLATTTSLWAIVFLKDRRSRSRRNATSPRHRVTGAWSELVDRLGELGVEENRNRTPRENAATLAAHPLLLAAGESLVDLADEVDAAMYRREPPSDADARNAWQRLESAQACATEGLTRSARMKARLDPKPLLRRGPR